MRATDEPSVTVTTDLAAYVAARGPALQRYAYLVTGSATDAADLVQEALIGAMPRWDSLVRRGTTEAYLRRSIANASVSRWRRDRRLVSFADPEPFLPVVERQPDADVAWELCSELSPLQRAAVVLRFHEDMSFAEVAATLGCAESTARSHVHRAVKALRSRLEATEENDE